MRFSFLVASSSTSHHLAQNAFASVGAPLSRLRAAAAQLLFNLCIEAPEKMISSLAQSEEVIQESFAPSYEFFSQFG